MAIEETLQNQMLDLVNEHWFEHVKGQGFAELISGKESGHRMADYVDDQTCSLLKVHLDTRYEGDGRGSVRKRSMGDIWVYSRDIFNPVNVKSGLQARNGQPNVVSMQKLLNYLFQYWIDSYYLLIVKFDVSETLTHKAYLFDLLDWLEFVAYDAGPGQIMLREQNFYDAIDSGYIPPKRSIQEKTTVLFNLFEEQLQALIVNRERRLNSQREFLEKFLDTRFTVDQSCMRFVL